MAAPRTATYVRGKALSPESLGSASLGLGSFLFPILWRSIRFKRSEQTARDAGYFFDSAQKGLFIGLRRFAETADLSHELQGSGPYLFVRDGRIEVEEGFNVSAHDSILINRRVPYPSIFDGWDSSVAARLSFYLDGGGASTHRFRSTRKRVGRPTIHISQQL